MKHTIAFLFICSAAFLFGQTQGKYEHVMDSLGKANKPLELIAYFQKELKAHPKDEDLLRFLGKSYILNNQLELAEKYYKEALVVNPKCARCYLNLGNIYAQKDDLKKALEFVDKAVVLDPADATAYSFRAKIKEFSGDQTGATADHKKAIELDPKAPEYYIERADYHYRNNNVSLALADFNKAIELKQDNFYPYFQRASIYYDKQMHTESLRDINSAIRIDSTQWKLYIGRGTIYSFYNEPKKALADFDKAVKLNPKEYIGYYNRSTERYKQEDMDGYCEDIQKAHALLLESEKENPLVPELENLIGVYCDPSRASYYYQRGIAFYNIQQLDQSIQIYTKGLETFPNNSMMLSFRGNAYLAKGEYESALTDYYNSIKNKANMVEDVQVNQKHSLGKDEPVNEYAEGIIASMQISIAEAKFALGQYDEALAAINTGIETAVELKDFGKENYYNVRGNIYLALGDYQQALNDFDKCIKLNSNFSIAYANRAIARVNATSKVKLTNFAIRRNGNQPLNVKWDLSGKSSKKTDPNVAAALADCTKAIDLDPQLDFAYYIRGQIKKSLGSADYCYDLIKARNLGYPVDLNLMKDCKK